MKPLSLRLLKRTVFRTKQYPEWYKSILSLTTLLGIYVIAKQYFQTDEQRIGTQVVLLLTAVASQWYLKHGQYSLDKNWLSPKLINGHVVLNDSEIIISTKSTEPVAFKLEDILTLKIDHAMYNGYTNGDLWLDKAVIRYSGACELTIKLKDHTEVNKFTILINDKEEMRRFLEYLKLWYRSGIQITESEPINNYTTVLFRFDWTYEQYQELKEELGVKEFYKKRF